MPPDCTGYELWRGPSRIDGEPIVLVAVVSSKNTKTGPMANGYVFRQDESPVIATQTGTDRSVCGDCPLRQFLGGNCYVAPEKAPTRVWLKWKSGEDYWPWPSTIEDFARGLFIRLTAHGDIDALPRDIPETLARVARMHTAYTQGWESAPSSWKAWCMASVHSEAEAVEARHIGWRTYRHLGATDERLPDEDVCPYKTSGHVIRCIECGRCNGGDGRSIVIDRH